MCAWMEKKLIFFDFDGTLFSHSTKSVPSGNTRVLRRLQELGHTIIVATGRGTEFVHFIKEAIPIRFDTIIVLNGQMIYEKGNIVYDNHIRLSSMEHIIRIAKENKIVYGGYDKNGEIVNNINDRVRQVWHNFNAPMPALKSNFENDTPLYQGHLYITSSEAAFFEPHLNDYVLNWSDPFLVNLIPKSAGKSQAIRWCMEKYGFTKEQTFAFGDGFNDRDMLLEVGHGIAMGNADQSIKDIAKYVTKSVDEDGIEYALIHYKLI